MARALLALATILLIGAVWFVLSTQLRTPDATPSGEARGQAPTAMALEPPKTEAERAPENTLSASATTGGASATHVSIVGRLLRFDRSAAGGATLAIRFEREDERYAIVETKPGPRASSGSDGRFQIAFEPVAGMTVKLEAALEGLATANWSWSELAAGKLIDLGDILMPSAASLEVRVLDAAGHELATGWSVSVDPPGAGDQSPFANPLSRRLDPLHATARFDALPVGRVVVGASHDVWVGTSNVPVELRAGETTRIDLTFDGADPSRCINVVARTEPIMVWGMLLNEVVLIDPSGKERIVPRRFPQGLSFFASDLDPVAYTVEVRDPRFQPWRADGVMAGTRVDALLHGNSAITLTTSTEDPPRDLVVTLTWIEIENSSQNFLEIVSSDRPMPANGRFGELLAGDIELCARARGRVPLAMKIAKLAPHEQRSIPLDFERGGRIAGRVIHPDHVGVKDVDVRAALRNEDRDEHGNFNGDDWAPSATHARTDGSGAFVLEGLAPGAWTLRATAAPSVQSLFDVSVTSSTDISDLEIQLPALGVLKGLVLAPDDLPLAKLSIVTRPILEGDAKHAFDLLVPDYRREMISGAVGADGRFRCTPVLAGEVEVSLAFPRVHRTFGFMASGESRGPLLSLGRVTLPPAGELERTFDLRGKIPPRAVVHVSVNGSVVPGLPVSVYPHGSMVVAASGDCGEDGRTTLSWLPEGSYEVYVNALDRSWGDAAPVPLDIKLSEAQVFEMNVRFIAGELELHGVDNTALADNTPISITRSGLPTGVDVGMDAKVRAGRLLLNVPAGNYVLTLLNGEHSALAKVEVRWPGTNYAELAAVEK